MPAATSKAALIAVSEKEYTALRQLISHVSEAMALEKDDEDTSIKDVVAHRAHWIDLFLGWWADGQAGLEVQFPAPGYKWSELKRYNADLRARQAGLGWSGACAALDAAHQRLMFFLAKHGQAALYGGPMKGARNEWTTGRWAEAAGASHYRSAGKYIRARLKALQD